MRGVLEYEGDFQNDKFHGQGYLRHLNKNSEYKGEFRDGMKHGKGVITEANGGTYEGDFENNHKHGRGVYTLREKKYEG